MPTEMNNVEQAMYNRQKWINACGAYDDIRFNQSTSEYCREQWRMKSVNATIIHTNFLATLTPAERKEYWKRLED